MPTVFVVSKDWALRAGLRAELREQGVDAKGSDTLADLGEAAAAGVVPSVIVFDAALAEPTAEFRGQMAALARQARMIVIAPRTMKLSGSGWISAAAAVLYRPVSIGEIAARVRKLLQGEEA